MIAVANQNNSSSENSSFIQSGRLLWGNWSRLNAPLSCKSFRLILSSNSSDLIPCERAFASPSSISK